jgi:two-component system, sporulation sensor kinase E
MMARPRKFQNLPSGPSRPVESLVRNVLAVGFLVMLMLVVGIGYRSINSLQQLENESVRVDETEEKHFRIVLDMSETVGKIFSTAQTVAANQSNEVMAFPARQHLAELRREMEQEVERARNSSLIDSQEWQQFESAYNAFWVAMQKPGPIGEEWHDERDRMRDGVKQLEKLVDRERELNNLTAHQMSLSARNRIIAATATVLAVGVIVAALALYEIRKNLNLLAGAYATSAESRDYLQSLLDSLVSGVVVIGQDGIVQTVSESFRKLPLAGSLMKRQSYKELFRESPPLLAAVSEELSEPRTRSRSFGRVDLGTRLFDVSISPLMIGGQWSGVIAVFVDITEEARAQTELQRNHALTAVGQMTAQIAHEIKNPLGSIRFAAEVLKRQRLSDTKEDLKTIQVIERSVDHLASICAELNEFARPKKLNQVETNLNNLLDELLPMVEDRLNSNQMEIVKQYSDLPGGYYDATELKKLFLNLIINAVEASQPNSSIVLCTRLNGSENMLVDIVDKGSGMDAETQKRLFEPFFTTKEKGTGLGMAIAKQIAELHGGDLIITSQVGVGTTATLRLPLTKSVEADNTIGAVQRLSR